MLDPQQTIRLECLKLALTTTREIPAVEVVAKRFATFVDSGQTAAEAAAPAAQEGKAEQTGDNQAG